MARPRQYDRDAVLDAATRLFWERGYEATSVDDLVGATGLNRASMYGAFGDKRGLFLAAIGHYVDTVMRDRLGVLDAPGSALAAITRFFEELIAFSCGRDRHLGCLMTNCAVGLVQRDSAIAAIWRDAIARAEDSFLRAVRRGQDEGEITTAHDAVALARSLVATLHGLRVSARAGVEPEVLRDVVAVALDGLRVREIRART